jgi:hypothetical protein
MPQQVGAGGEHVSCLGSGRRAASQRRCLSPQRGTFAQLELRMPELLVLQSRKP